MPRTVFVATERLSDELYGLFVNQPTELTRHLRVMVLTDPKPRCGRSLSTVVAECLDAGATAIQLRDKDATAREIVAQAKELAKLTAAADALLIINDRFDLAIAAGTNAVHLGPEDLPVAAVRRIAPKGFVIGYSTDDPEEAQKNISDGADYLGVGAVYGTTSKSGLADEAIGPNGVSSVMDSVNSPCVGIGGITPANAKPVLQTGAGIAVLSAVMGAPNPGAIVREFVSMSGEGT